MEDPNKTEADFVYERYIQSDIDVEDVISEDADPVLIGDKYLAADIGLNLPEESLERSDLQESAAFRAAETAGLINSDTNYAEEEDLLEMEDEELPLEDIPDADELQPGSKIDPASPPVDEMPGTDVLNGSHGE